MDKRSELRRHARKSFSQQATIVSLDGSPIGTCRLFDVSEAGARLIVPEPVELTDEFILVFSRYGPVRRQCCIAWRSSNTIGVRFVR
jgi:hypothetical protein